MTKHTIVGGLAPGLALALSASVVLAGSPESGDPARVAAFVTGTASCAGEITHFQLDEPPYTAGVALECQEAVSDPRVSGQSTMTIDTEGWEAGSIAWTEHRISGPDGRWAGRGYGFYDAEDVLHVIAMLAGEGAYEGLVYAYEAGIPSVDEPIPVTISGLVQPGPAAPGYPSLAEPSPSPEPATLRTIGQPADDGARIVGVAEIDDRVTDLTIDSPAVGLAKVRLLLPRAFAAKAGTRWPVLYLLQGATDDYTSWSTGSDVAEIAALENVLVVMPAATADGVEGWYTDWRASGSGGQPHWETFHVVELRQLLERNWRAGDARAVAGLSMGGYGAVTYAARNPGSFRAAASYSGALDLKVDPWDFTRPDDLARWGDPLAGPDAWEEHDPIRLAPRLAGLPLYIAYGDGQPGPLDPEGTEVDAAEQWIARGNEAFVAALHAAGVDATVNAYGPGTHTWPYWEREFHASLPMLLDALGAEGVSSGSPPP